MLSINFKTTTVTILTDPVRQFHFDYSGRLIGHFNHGDHYRIGLDGTILFKSSNQEAEDCFLPIADVQYWWKEWEREWEDWRKAPDFAWTKSTFDTEPLDVSEFLGRIFLFLKNISFNHQQFLKIWGRIPILPPEFYQSVIVNFTVGCSYDDCTFCTFYKDRPFQIRSIETLNDHLLEISDFFGDGLSARRDIFIGEANALAAPNRRFIFLMEELQDWISEMKALNPRFRVNRIGSFLDGFTGHLKDADEWKMIRQSGLSDIAIGIESGSEDLLKGVGKPYDPEIIIQMVNRIKEAGFRLQLIFLLGLGGKKYRDSHFEASVSMISRFNLSPEDRVQLSLFNPAISTGNYPFKDDLLTSDELDQEYVRWKSALNELEKGISVRKYPTQFFIV